MKEAEWPRQVESVGGGDRTFEGRGLQDVPYFREFDARYVTKETGPRSEPGAETVQFDPASGSLYVARTQENPYGVREMTGFNLRMGHSLGMNDRERNPMEDPVLRRAVEALGPEAAAWLEAPPGYPEVQEVIERTKSGESLALEALPSSVVPGEHLLFHDCRGLLRGFKVAEIVPASADDEHLQGGYRIRGEGTSMKFYSGFEPAEEDGSVMGPLASPASAAFRKNAPRGIWKMSERDFETLRKHQPRPNDPSIEYPLAREEYAVAVAMDGMAFERWAAGVDEIRASNPARYEGVTKENLGKAVGELVSRFGEPAFTRALEWVASQHALRLHVPEQRTSRILAQDNAFGDAHSDILGFKKDVSGLARDVISNAHPVAVDMEVDGYGPVGFGVYNATSLFGDVELLEILRDGHPDVFRKFVDAVAHLPPMDQGTTYGGTTVHPLRAVRQYFPEAYALMKEGFSGDWPEAEGPGLTGL